MLTRKRTAAAFALVALATWACSPDDYPTGSRFDPPPEEVELPDGELFYYTPPAGVTITSVSIPGEFNGWNPGDPDAQMIQLPDGRWVGGIEDLAEGAYQYKYHFNHDATGAGGDWAGDMCEDATYGDPDNSFIVDPNLTSCDPGGNAIRVIGTPGYTFLYLPRADQDVNVVTVAGNFQDPQWNNTTDTLWNIYTLTVDLDPGTYQYKYVFNDGGWAGDMCDEANWGHPDYNNQVDPDNGQCANGGANQDAEIVIEEAGPHTFRYIVPAGTDSIAQIHLAGSFQGWNNNDPAYLFQETYQRTYELESGTYEYKFIFDGNWAGNMCTDTGTWGDPTTGLVDANNTDGCPTGENATLVVD